MSCRVVLELKKVMDIKFDDIDQLNKELWLNDDVQDLYGNTEPDPNFVPYKDPILVNGLLLEIASVSEGTYFEKYDTCTDTWGILGREVFQIIANHMTSGKIVIVEIIEGDDLEVSVLTSNTVRNVSFDDLLKDL